ncbi:MAG: hypothetical protein QM680_13125 [Luteolibacter sp.]
MIWDLIEILIRIVWFPYLAWKRSGEDSRIGTSPMDRETQEFWKGCGIVATVIMIGVGGIVWWMFN